MNNKKAAPQNHEAALTPKVNPIINKILCPRQKRVLNRLIKGSTTVRELFGVAGNNPAETISQLRRRGIDIECLWNKGIDQDGKSCRYGEYYLDVDSLAKAKSLLGGE